MQKRSHILIIEDDPAVAAAVRSAVEREGFRTTWKDTGQAGLDFVREGAPDLIILDVRLPDKSGLDVCRNLRQMGTRQPILILTVRGEETDKVLGLEMGADDYLTKPFGIRELISRIRALLRRSYGDLSSQEAEIFYIRDLTIDRSKGQVRRGDEFINLTPTEFRLLSYFSQHTGQAITRQQIIENVWGFSADLADERGINVHIRRLREKIELEPSKPTLLLTVPGIGYRLTP